MKQIFLLLFLSVFALAAFGQTPPVLDPSNPDSIVGYWQFLYALAMPVGNYLLSILWPSNTRKELTLKTTIFAIVVLVFIVTFKGVSFAVIMQAVLAFFAQALTYDKVLNPIGLNSKAAYKEGK